MRFFRSLLAALTLCVLAPMANASQGSGCLPLTGVYSGLTAAIDINAAIAALISTNSGASPPATDCSGAAILAQQWFDTSDSKWEIYDGSQWIESGTLDSVNHLWYPKLGGGVQTLAAASTTDLCAAAQTFVTITGATTINSFGSSCQIGQARFVNFSSVLTIAYSSSAILLPTAANLATQAGDQAIAVYLGGGIWRISSYTRADGSALLAPFYHGEVRMFASTSCPSPWIPEDGRSLSTTTYASLYASIGYAYGGSGASFNVPNSGGQFMRGYVSGQTVDSGRTFGATQLDAFQGHQFNYSMFQFAGGASFQYGTNGLGTTTSTTGAPIALSSYGTPRYAAETRPTNITVTYCIYP